ncbi:Kinesin light chain [Rhizoctonia solani]|uniref:Kinesin light chain n=1 Tax=Rhizoctonia solani TaxID=456999 RepID=A0A0K6G351_9AGAM|nr:Kinesin light chain [Rhizoctonia solani]
MSNHREGNRGLNILCIDGGGVRGLSSLIILQEIMRHAANAKSRDKIHPYEHFDIIAGTGTGGVSACMLGRLRMPIDKAIEEYAKLVQDVFKDKKMTGPSMYKRTKLEEALKTMIRNVTRNEGEMMSEGREDNGCKTMVFAMAKHNLNAALPVMFRSYTVATNPGPDCTISDVLCATMAQPGLFKSIDIVDSAVPQSFVGGELGCSNPLAHVMSEVARIYPDRPVGCVVSIGAGHTRTIKIPDLSWWYRTQDVVVMKDMAVDAERVAEEMMLRFQGTSGVYFRFNVDQGMQDMKDGSWERLGEAMQHTRAYLQKSATSQMLDKMVNASLERRGAVSVTHAAGQASGILEATTQVTGFKCCPPPTKFYTGRGSENAQVIQCITGGKGERRVCVVHGLGGTGKTQLVLNVVERTWDEWNHVIYVDASSAEAIEKALKDFGTARNVGETYKNAIAWLESCAERWLMVFDNADTLSTNVRQYIPSRGHNGSVMITTRLPDLANLAKGPGSVCHLSSMSQTDGVALLLKTASSDDQCPPDDNTQAAEELDFGRLALAIVHAGAYIAHSPGMTIAKYRSLFLSQRRRMLEEYAKLPEAARLDERGDTVYTTWKMCYDQLQPESRELLWLTAYLHYDGIFEEIFERAARNIQVGHYTLPPTELELQACDRVRQYLLVFLDSNGNWDTVKFTRVMADLRSYSLIDFDRMNLTYRIHVLVHDWAKTVIPHTPELAIECTATLLSLSIDWEEHSKSLAFKRQLGLHVTAALTHNPNIGANHSDYMQEVYRYTGQWEQRAKLLHRLLSTFREELGEESLKTWSTIRNLAQTYSNLGQYEEVLRLRKQVLDAYKRLHGEEHPATLNCMYDLSCSYLNLGRYDEAEQLQMQTLDAYKRVMGEEHPYTRASMNVLAQTYARLGRFGEVERLQVQALDAYKQVLGSEHPSTLISMNNLALLYSRLGRYKDAEQLQVQTLNACKRVMGEEHPDTFLSMSALAATYGYLGRHDEAAQLQIQALNKFKRVLGEEHPITLGSMGQLALSYSHLGRYSDAEQLQMQTLDAYKRVMGEEHHDTLDLMYSLAGTYGYLGRHNQAEQLQIRALNGCKRVLGEQHPDTLSCMYGLASSYSCLGRYKEAEQLQVQVLDMRKQIIGEEHPHTLNSMNGLAATYGHLGRHDQAEQLQIQALNGCKRVLGEEHPDTLRSMRDLALSYLRLGRHSEAEQLLMQTLDACKRVMGEEHLDTLLSMNGLAVTYGKLRRHDEAAQLQMQALNGCKRVLGEEHPATLNSTKNLAWSYSCLGRWEEAEGLYKKAITGAERILGDQHPETELYRKGLSDTQNMKQEGMRNNRSANRKSFSFTRLFGL